jgi:predicted DNA-binding antitoxin AbrB/MazE fold protein
MTIPARYENGIFRPLEEVAIKEGTVVEVHLPAGSKSPRDRRSVKDLSFFGLWADRGDITDGISYVNDVRDSPRG